MQQKKINFSDRKKSLVTLLIYAVLFYTGLTGCTNEHVTEGSKKADSLSLKTISDLFDRSDEWKAPDTVSIAADDAGNLIRYGKSLIVNTASYLGPKGGVSHSSNGMNCQNCHRDAGTRLYGNSFSAVAATYPRFRPRSGTMESVEKRINDCMQRSLNGKALDTNSREMKAMVAYIKWIGKDVEKGKPPKGANIVELPFLDRAADPVRGKIGYEKHCVTCHGADGQGKLNEDGASYQYPPLWGEHSYNISAGMLRLTRLAGYIKSNMPDLTSSYEKPVLTDEEAWDIAAFVNSMPRPEKRFSQDWPDFSIKPFDFPYGPYGDSFSEAQHRNGPFAPIAALKKKK
ncbi:MAG: c-type cytochrome [Bacteroidia bacterium]